MGLVWAIHEIMGVKCLVRSQELAIFITYHNANFLNKVHLFMAPLNPIPQSQFYYSLYSTELGLHNYIHLQISDLLSKEEVFSLWRKDHASFLAVIIG